MSMTAAAAAVAARRAATVSAGAARIAAAATARTMASRLEGCGLRCRDYYDHATMLGLCEMYDAAASASMSMSAAASLRAAVMVFGEGPADGLSRLEDCDCDRAMYDAAAAGSTSMSLCMAFVWTCWRAFWIGRMTGAARRASELQSTTRAVLGATSALLGTLVLRRCTLEGIRICVRPRHRQQR